MKWKAVGRDAVIVYFAETICDESLARSLAIAAELERNPPPGLRDFIPSYTSVLVQFETHREQPLSALAKTLVARFQTLKPVALADSPPAELPVRYDGEDLPRVAEMAKLSVQEVVELHCAPVYRVHVIGFTPGFPFLGGLDPRLHTPRLSKPRLTVRAGAVGIGGAQTGIYTVDGPGGWNIIGHTTVRVYDLSRANPFLLKQGDRVKFIPMM